MDLRCVLPAACCLALASGVVADDSHPAPTMADVVAASKPSDWRPLDPEYTLYLQMATGRIVIELAPAFAPEHIANIRTLVRQGYFDGLAIYRSQDNFVVQWGGPDSKLCRHRARAPVPRSKYRAGRARRAGHGVALGTSARYGAARVLRETRAACPDQQRSTRCRHADG